MPDFQRVAGAVMLPGICATCGRSGSEPMTDTLAEFPPPGGRIYLCDTCIDEANRLRGGLDPAQAAELTGRLVTAQEQINELGVQLDRERNSKVVPIAEVRRQLRHERKARVNA